MTEMGNLLIYFAAAASLLLGACGSDVEESESPPIAAVEESDSPSILVVEESAVAPISMAELAGRIQAGSAPLVLDVRSPKEYARTHIRGAINIPHDELSTRLAELPIAKSEEVVVYSERGQRAQLAEETLRRSGYSNVRQLSGRPKEWERVGLPIE
jgi:rhodanese-related sulfurtransferase